MSNRRFFSNGFTLVEMIVTLVLFAIVAAVGSQLLSKLLPSYFTNVHAEQALSPREAAMWRLSEDFRQALVDGMGQEPYPLCTLSMQVVSGLAGEQPITYWVRYWYENDSLKMSDVFTSGILMNDVVTQENICPISYAGCGGRRCLHLNFHYAPGSNSKGTTDIVKLPISTILYSYAAGPFVSAIVPSCGLETGGIIAAVKGTGLLGTNRITIGGLAAALGVVASTTVQVTVSAHSFGIVSVSATTPEGKTTLKNSFRYLRLDPNNGTNGTSITIYGGGFTNTTGVKISNVAATNFVSTVSAITINAPALPTSGLAPITIDGITGCTVPAAFTYN